ncbi:MAG: glycosyltransferase [Luteitalea sp.]|nr:glycosyltransferase [Luteitalea sp.]
MKILVVHNAYTQPGGEDVVFHAEIALLEAHGHQVVRYTADNHDLRDSARASVAARTIWNGASLRDVRALIRQTRPDLMHVHNTFPLISPTVYHAAQAEGVRVVQTLHNFRLICPNAMLRRAGHTCEECVGTSTRWPGVVHGCYRGSRAATGVIAAMLTTHGVLGTWRHKIDRYIALSEFAKSKFVQDGWPEAKIVVKPNFVECEPPVRNAPGDYVLFVGRLSQEKGLSTLLRAMATMSHPPLLKIAGQGPLMDAGGPATRIEWLGQQTREQTLALMCGASMLIMPSEWYEGMPLTIVEAFAMGLPVITSRIGTMAEMVSHGLTGLLFPPGDANALADTIGWALAHPGEMEAIAVRARQEFDCKYTPEHNYRRLMEIYHGALS